MATDRDTLKYAVQALFNDVIEQAFHHLVNYPQHSDELNRVIRDCMDELNYQLLKIDSHGLPKGSIELSAHYSHISADSQRQSLELLHRLQKVQMNDIPRLKRV